MISTNYIGFLSLLCISIIYYGGNQRIIASLKYNHLAPQTASFSLNWITNFAAFLTQILFLYQLIHLFQTWIVILQSVPTVGVVILLVMSFASTLKNLLILITAYPKEVGISHTIKEGSLSSYLSFIGYNIIMALLVIIPFAITITAATALR